MLCPSNAGEDATRQLNQLKGLARRMEKSYAGKVSLQNDLLVKLQAELKAVAFEVLKPHGMLSFNEFLCICVVPCLLPFLLEQ